MPSPREARGTPASARDFIVRVADTWRTPPSAPSYAPSAAVDEPLLARTSSGWLTDAHDGREDADGSDSTTRSASPANRLRPASSAPNGRRRWLIGCFAVILLAGAGWSISSSESADLTHLKDHLDATVSRVQEWTSPGLEVVPPNPADAIPSEDDDGREGPGRDQSDGTAAATPTGGEALPRPTDDSPPLNVNSRPRPPPPELAHAPQQRYLAFENHSGFHNQRKALVNALVLAQLLNRTLLLPPARLGAAIPWEPDPKHTTVFSERCKAGLEPDKPVAHSSKSHLIMLGEACDPPMGWTYVGWDYLIAPELLDGRALIDRWNSSWSWLHAAPEHGGLGLVPADVHVFADNARRSYQILDSRGSKMDKLFESRLELDDLRDPAGLGAKPLLQFGSLFSGARLQLTDPANRALYDAAYSRVVLRNDGLDAISREVRDALGSYVAVHARVGDGAFKTNAEKNMHRLFENLCVEVFGLQKARADQLWAAGSASSRRKRTSRRTRHRRSVQGLSKARSLSVDYAGLDEVDDEEAEHDIAHLAAPPEDLLSSAVAADSPRLSRRGRSHRRDPLRGSPARGLAPHLRCRGPLHDATTHPDLALLNTPLYIATDSRRPLTDPHLAAFLKWFPCTFVLGDFASQGDVNEQPVFDLVQLASSSSAGQSPDANAPNTWRSDWDGSDLGRFLLPFLEAEIAARGVRVLGTHQSTFSGYVTTVLHDDYARQGLVAPWQGP